MLSIGVGVHVACGKKFNYYSFGGSASMYTACGCGLQVRVAAGGSFQSGILPLAVSYRKQHRTFLLKIFKVIWYQNLRLIKLDTMVNKLLKSDHKQENYSYLKKSY